MSGVPGAWDGPLGPRSPRQYAEPHVYARDVQSGAGNCVCGSALGDRLHTEAAPGVPVPEAMRWHPAVTITVNGNTDQIIEQVVAGVRHIRTHYGNRS